MLTLDEVLDAHGSIPNQALTYPVPYSGRPIFSATGNAVSRRVEISWMGRAASDRVDEALVAF